MRSRHDDDQREIDSKCFQPMEGLCEQAEGEHAEIKDFCLAVENQRAFPENLRAELHAPN